MNDKDVAIAFVCVVCFLLIRLLFMLIYVDVIVGVDGVMVCG
jgi:hypothetical protein